MDYDFINYPKIIGNMNVKEDYDMDKIITYFGYADVFSAIILSRKLKCGLIKECDLGNIKAKEIIRVGGKPGTDR